MREGREEVEEHHSLTPLQGRLKEAEQVANILPDADLVTWKTILGACRVYQVSPHLFHLYSLNFFIALTYPLLTPITNFLIAFS